jgi:protease I
MANPALQGLDVAILVDDGFEQSELLGPRSALAAAGATTRVVSPRDGRVRGWNHTDWGEPVAVDVKLADARADDYDALLLPGGVMNPDRLRMDKDAVAFVKAFFDAGKPVAAICHGPWTVLEAGFAKGRRMTSWPSLRTDLRNAGAEWVDEEVVVDGNLVTSRKPDDIPAFNREAIKLFEKARSAAP